MEVGLSIFRLILMTYPTVPNPVIIPLEFLRDGRVGAIGRDQYAVFTVMASFTVE